MKPGDTASPACVPGLQSLDLKVRYSATLSSLNTMIRRLLGNLESLTQLRWVRITVWRDTHPAEWSELDGLLGRLPALGDAHIHLKEYSRTPQPAAAARLLGAWMPVLAGRSVLRMHGYEPLFEV